MNFSMDTWFGQVGSETWTVTPGLPIRAISKACRIAPVPPTVDSMAVRALSRVSASTIEDSASR